MSKNENHSFNKEVPHSPSKGVVTEKTEQDAQTNTFTNSTQNKSSKNKNKEY